MSSLLYPKQPSKQPIRRLSLTPTQRSMLKLQLRRGGTIPLTSGYLEKDATVIAAAGGAIAGFEWEEKMADFTARVNMGYYVDTALNDVTMTLPSAPAPGTEVAFFVIGDNALNIVSTDLIQGAALLQDWGRQPTETYLIYVFNFVGGSTGWTWDVRYDNRVGAVYLGGMWNPSLISTALWLDASRTESITLESGAVSQWSDLSGNDRHAEQGNASNRPTLGFLGGVRSISFDGAASCLKILATALTLPQPFTIFIVCKSDKTSYSSTQRSYVFDQFTSASDSSRCLFALAGNNTGKNSLYATSWAASTFDIDLNTHIFNLVFNGASSLILRDTLASATLSPGTTSLDGLTIGSNYLSSSDWFEGELGEFVVLSSLINTPLRQKVEGYLAHKWGLTDSLPNAHPYKAVPPGVDPDPYIDNVVLYLKGDGSDGSTYITDSSLDPKTITRNGNAQISTAQSKYGGSSLYFDGDSDSAAITYSSDLNFSSGEATIEAWVYSQSNTGFRGIFSAFSTNLTGWIVRTHNGVLYFNKDTSNLINGGTFPLNTWVHVALVVKPPTVFLYVNGVVVGQVNTTMPNYTHPLGVGAVYSAGGTYGFETMQGYIDSLRITKGIARYTANFNPETDTYLSYPTVAPPSDPYIDSVVLHLKGDGANDSTTIVDSSPTPKTITRYDNAKISTVESVYGGSSMYFDGSGDYLTAPSSTDFAFGTSDFTVELWAYPFTLNYVQYGKTLIDMRPDSTNGQYLSASVTFNTGNIAFNINNTGYEGSIAVAVGKWFHVAVARQAGVLKMFVNGVESYSGTHTNNLVSSGTIKIAGNAFRGFAPDTYFNGYIDSLRITKGIARYTNRFNPITDTYLAY